MTEKETFFSLMAKEFNDGLDNTEKESLEKILKNSESLKNQYFLLKELWFRSHPKNIHHRIIERTEKKLAFTYRRNSPLTIGYFYKIAVTVLLIISLGISGLLFFQQKKYPTLREYHSNSDEIKEFFLSDGTKVWLNSNSYLLAMEPFTGNIREVKLFGEAYFEVEHNAKKPFIVETPNLCTEVLGTTFNINSWPNSKITEISLYEGKVRLTPSIENKNNIILSPGQQAQFNKDSGELKISKTEGENRAEWRSGVMAFYNDELNYIAKALERKFEKRILVTDETAGLLKYTAEFSDEPLEKILQLLSEAKAFSYDITEQGVIIRSSK